MLVYQRVSLGMLQMDRKVIIFLGVLEMNRGEYI
jgi:hypothetical protein